MDQAASLRQWATERGSARPANRPVQALKTCDLMVLGLPGTSRKHAEAASERLQSWAEAGHQWLGDPRRWRCVPVSTDDPRLHQLALDQARWALWVDADLGAFERGYHTLRELAARGGPGRLLAFHAVGVPRKGLLSNLQSVASTNFGLELLVLTR